MLMHQWQNPYANVPFQQSFVSPTQSSGWSGSQNVNWSGFQPFNVLSNAYSYRFQPSSTGNMIGNQPISTGFAGSAGLRGNVPFTQSFNSGIGAGATPYARTSFGISEPQIDISETKNDIVLACDLPNVNLNNLNLTVSENSCAISAQSMLNGQNIALHRTVPLPTLVRAEAVDTNYANGILQIRLPKKNINSRKQINVNMSQ